MRQFLRLLGYSLLSIFTVDMIIAGIDYAGRWQWLTTVIDTHPHIAVVVRTRFALLPLLVIGLLVLYAERKLKQPRLVARLINSRFVPDIHTTTIGDVFDTQEKKAGWDEKKLNWRWLAEVQVANDADTPATIEGIETRAWIRRRLWQRNVKVSAKHDPNTDDYRMDFGHDEQGGDRPFQGTQYRKVDNLIEKTRNVPLTRGIGYRGWLRIDISQVSQRDAKDLKVDIWLVDALQNRHKVHFSRREQKQWDRGFYMLAD